jgi:RNA-directed DNA polymerase
MTVTTMTGAASHGKSDWNQINWDKVRQTVRRLQVRIAKAVKEGRWGRVKALQRLLTTSFSGKALAVKRVTENQGKRTGQESQGNIVAQTAGLSSTAAETGFHTQGKR